MSIAKPNFFMVGAPRCATTAMNRFLKLHPDIYMAGKESHFFTTDHNASYVIKDEADYKALFEGAAGEKVIGEASVNNIYSKTAAVNIKKYSPSAKILIMVRNPIDLLYSLYKHYVYGGAEFVDNFMEAIEADELRRFSPDRLDSRCFSGDYYSYKDMVKLAAPVQQYLDVFGPDQVMVVNFDDFSKNTAEVYLDVLKFLEVDPFLPEFSVVNGNRNVHSVILQRIITNQRLNTFFENIGINAQSNYLFRALKRLNTVVENREPMDDASRIQLAKEFAEDINWLAELSAVNSKSWK